jgi:hypothetical protein
MVRKSIKSAIVTSLVLAIAACTNTIPNNLNILNSSKPFPAIENFEDLDREYRFATKELTQSYLKRKLDKWLCKNDQVGGRSIGCPYGPQLVKEINYARYKHPQLFCAIVNEDHQMLLDIKEVQEVQARSSIDSAFAAFLDSCFVPDNEFQVNTYNSGYQINPATAMDADGDFIVTWQSYRQDYNGNYNIYAQRYYSGGGAKGSEFQVSSFTNTSNINSAVAMDDAGDFVVAWQSYDYNNYYSYYDIYARRYNSSGVPDGPEFRVNDFTGWYQENPTIAMDASGDYVIGWNSYGQEQYYYEGYYTCYNYGESGGTICYDGHYTGGYYYTAYNRGVFARRYNAVSQPQGSEFQVNTYITGDQILPSAAIDSAGDFVITWQSRQYNGYDIYAQRYNNNGDPDPQGEFRVNSFTFLEQVNSSVAMDDAGDFTVTWEGEGYDEYNRGIYARRYDSQGIGQGTEFRVNTYTDDGQYEPSIAMNSNGDFVITWDSYQQDGDQSGVFGKGFDRDGIQQGTEFQVNQYFTNNQYQPVTAIDNGTNFVIAWTSRNQDDPNSDGIFARTFHTLSGPSGSSGTSGTSGTSGSSGSSCTPGLSGSPVSTISGETRINSYTTNFQVMPSVARSTNGDFVVVWESWEQDCNGIEVYAQRYSSDGVPAGSEFRINNTTDGDQEKKSVAMDSQGNFVVAWTTPGEGGFKDVYARKFDNSGNPFSDEFLVNSFTTGNQWYPDVAFDGSGNFVITWASENQDSSGWGIYAQRYGSTGPVGGEIQVNESVVGNQEEASIGMDSSGNFTIAWTASIGLDGDGRGVFAKQFDNGGNALGSEFQVNSYNISDQISPSVAMNSSGNFVIAWSSYQQDGNNWGVFGQRFNQNGTPAGSEFPVNTSVTSSVQDYPVTAINNNGDFIITWESMDITQSGEWDVMAKRFNSNGNTLSGDLLINTTTTSGQFLPSVGMDASGNFIIAWGDNLYQDGDRGGIHGKRFDVNGNEL